MLLSSNVTLEINSYESEHSQLQALLHWLYFWDPAATSLLYTVYDTHLAARCAGMQHTSWYASYAGLNQFLIIINNNQTVQIIRLISKRETLIRGLLKVWVQVTKTSATTFTSDVLVWELPLRAERTLLVFSERLWHCCPGEMTCRIKEQDTL